MSYRRAGLYSGIADGLNNINRTVMWHMDRQDRLKQQERQNRLMDIQEESAKLNLSRAKQQQADEDMSKQLITQLLNHQGPLPDEAVEEFGKQYKQTGQSLDEIMQAGSNAQLFVSLAERLQQQQQQAGKQSAPGQRFTKLLDDSSGLLQIADRALLGTGDRGKRTFLKDKLEYRTDGLDSLWFDNETQKLGGLLKTVYLDPKTGQETQGKPVPLTVGATNDGNDPIAFKSVDELKGHLLQQVVAGRLAAETQERELQRQQQQSQSPRARGLGSQTETSRREIENQLLALSPTHRQDFIKGIAADRQQEQELGKINKLLDTGYGKQAREAMPDAVEGLLAVAETVGMTAKEFGTSVKALTDEVARLKRQGKEGAVTANVLSALVATGGDESKVGQVLQEVASMGIPQEQLNKALEAYNKVSSTTTDRRKAAAAIKKDEAAASKNYAQAAEARAKTAGIMGGGLTGGTANQWRNMTELEKYQFKSLSDSLAGLKANKTKILADWVGEPDARKAAVAELQPEIDAYAKQLNDLIKRIESRAVGNSSQSAKGEQPKRTVDVGAMARLINKYPHLKGQIDLARQQGYGADQIEAYLKQSLKQR